MLQHHFERNIAGSCEVCVCVRLLKAVEGKLVLSSVLGMYSSNPKFDLSIKCKKKSSTVKVLNVDTFLYCKPKRFFFRKILRLDFIDPMQIDTPGVHAFKSKALSINKVQEEIINSKGA